MSPALNLGQSEHSSILIFMFPISLRPIEPTSIPTPFHMAGLSIAPGEKKYRRPELQGPLVCCCHRIGSIAKIGLLLPLAILQRKRYGELVPRDTGRPPCRPPGTESGIQGVSNSLCRLSRFMEASGRIQSKVVTLR